MRHLLIVPLVAMTVSIPAAAGSTPSPLADAVHETVTDGFPATVVRVRNGDQVTELADGVADRRTGAPARTGDRFRIASNTKSFVAVVLLQLEAEGALSLDDPVDRWLPGLLPDRSTTVRMLLNHTSGIGDPTEQRAFWAPYLDRGQRGYVYPPDRVIAMALAHQRPTPGGYRYSNTNYLIAGKIITAVTGKRPETEVRDRLIDPLGLRDTYFPTLDPYLHGPHLHGYDLRLRDLTVFSPSYDWTAGAMVSTVDDLARFHRALFAGDLLPAAQQAELTDAVDSGDGTGYGLGVERKPSPCGGGTLWGATGSGPGYVSVSLVSADGRRQLTMVSTRFDVLAEIDGTPPVPTGAGYQHLLTAALCPAQH